MRTLLFAACLSLIAIIAPAVGGLSTTAWVAGGCRELSTGDFEVQEYAYAHAGASPTDLMWQLQVKAQVFGPRAENDDQNSNWPLGAQSIEAEAGEWEWVYADGLSESMVKSESRAAASNPTGAPILYVKEAYAHISCSQAADDGGLIPTGFQCSIDPEEGSFACPGDVE